VQSRSIFKFSGLEPNLNAMATKPLTSELYLLEKWNDFQEPDPMRRREAIFKEYVALGVAGRWVSFCHRLISATKSNLNGVEISPEGLIK